ncbi:cytochrome P450 [Sistotremastrum niveocremeum HHB9708]|uniref:Cytochrome P450 n=1 Tax=Sistotremastrum niveocremeum HHB9708 TaxID=1314777 RepID=A0A164VBA4_9AGAM|nr:cytochrome P450 [Sistotremastrum niveocremeum HHB9708]
MDAPNRVYALQRPLMPSCMSLLYPELVLGLCFIAWKVYRWHQERLENPRSLPLPPGPKGFLFLGNALEIKKDPWLRFSEWHNYGDVIGLTVLGRKVAVLNTWEAADELFNKRGAIYSNRPPRILTTKYGGWDFSLISFPYGETFLRQRRFLSQSIGAGPVKSMYPLITKNARALAGHLIGGSKDIQSLLRLAGTANIISMSYGLTVTLDNPKWVEHLDSVLQGLSGLGTPGAHPVDIFPIRNFLSRLKDCCLIISSCASPKLGVG